MWLSSCQWTLPKQLLWPWTTVQNRGSKWGAGFPPPVFISCIKQPTMFPLPHSVKRSTAHRYAHCPCLYVAHAYICAVPWVVDDALSSVCPAALSWCLCNKMAVHRFAHVHVLPICIGAEPVHALKIQPTQQVAQLGVMDHMYFVISRGVQV